MEKINWDQKAVLREELLFAFVILAFFIFFFKVLYPIKTTALKVTKVRYDNLALEKNALLKFESVMPQNTTSPEARGTTSMNPQVRALLSNAFRSQPDPAEFLQVITNMRFLGSVKVVRVESTEGQGDNYKTSSFMLNVRGDFRDIIQYISQIESLEAVIKLSEITMRIFEKDASDVDLQIKIDYYVIGKT